MKIIATFLMITSISALWWTVRISNDSHHMGSLVRNQQLLAEEGRHFIAKSAMSEIEKRVVRENYDKMRNEGEHGYVLLEKTIFALRLTAGFSLIASLAILRMSKNRPNQSSEPTAMSVTPPAGQESRQP
jgi:hypothetical protein